MRSIEMQNAGSLRESKRRCSNLLQVVPIFYSIYAFCAVIFLHTKKRLKQMQIEQTRPEAAFCPKNLLIFGDPISTASGHVLPFSMIV